MINFRNTYHLILFFFFLGFITNAQEVTSMNSYEHEYKRAYDFAFEGKHEKANQILIQLTKESKERLEANYLLAKTYSWKRAYAKARAEFNRITSKDPNNVDYWIAAIKNELYANENATALGLANKAIFYKPQSNELVRLKKIAEERFERKVYPKLGWHNTTEKTSKKTIVSKNDIESKSETKTEKPIKPSKVGVNNSYTVFNERYDPIFFSSISYNHRTKFGSIIPKLNYSNRSGVNGVQYDIDLYPKFLKRFYAYLNYGYSNSTLYPNHKVGGDIYANLPGAIELSAGGRYIVTASTNITAITNSIGHYRGNYYFSLRSFITPRSNNLTRFSGNLLTRKYLKDGENYFGISVGLGYSPELRQTITGGVLLAETLLFIESQRLNLEYQFTSSNSQKIYKARLGLRRQELAFDSGNFFWAVTAGLNYQVKL